MPGFAFRVIPRITRALQSDVSPHRHVRAEFEEKTYEQYLTAELARDRPFFSPGQVFEHVVGFDVALRTSDRRLWRHFPHMYPWWHYVLGSAPVGVLPMSAWWRELEDDMERFPKFKFNCFLQVKRPSRMVRADAAEYESWNAPYFRYDTRGHQQEALELLAQRTNGNAIVAYAAAAFHKLQHLWSAVSDREVVQRSNFCGAEKLNGHERYSYAAAGNTGIAHSDPTPIESVPFEQAFEQLIGQEPAQSNLAFLKQIGELIDDAAERMGPLFLTYKTIVAELIRDVDSELARSLAQIYAFELVGGLKLLVAHEA